MRTYLFKRTDGGPESTVTGWFLVELKHLLTIAVLRFQSHGREAFHTHAFDSISWVLKGTLVEQFLGRLPAKRTHRPSWRPFRTKATDYHRVLSSEDNAWVFTIRGRWLPFWREYHPRSNLFLKLAKGRKILRQEHACY